jgi:hypothetical protein
MTRYPFLFDTCGVSKKGGPGLRPWTPKSCPGPTLNPFLPEQSAIATSTTLVAQSERGAGAP